MFDLKGNILFALKRIEKEHNINADEIVISSTKYSFEQPEMSFNVFISGEPVSIGNSYNFNLTDLLGVIRGNTVTALMQSMGFTLKKIYEMICENHNINKENSFILFRKRDVVKDTFLIKTLSAGKNTYHTINFNELK